LESKLPEVALAAGCAVLRKERKEGEFGLSTFVKDW
jgi:hypothetical protein